MFWKDLLGYKAPSESCPTRRKTGTLFRQRFLNFNKEMLGVFFFFARWGATNGVTEGQNTISWAGTPPYTPQYAAVESIRFSSWQQKGRLWSSVESLLIQQIYVPLRLEPTTSAWLGTSWSGNLRRSNLLSTWFPMGKVRAILNIISSSQINRRAACQDSDVKYLDYLYLCSMLSKTDRITILITVDIDLECYR